MEQTKTKKALIMSVLSVFLCIAMLIGMTFAWFTDTASTGVNKIQAGNLKMEVTYKNSENSNEWNIVNKETNVFKKDTLWEPGHVEYAVLNVKNVGNLALKYKLGINIASETGSTNVNGDAFKLSDYIKFAVVDGDATVASDGSSVTRADLLTAAGTGKALNAGYTKESSLTTNGDNETVTLVVWMPESVGNEANYDATKGNAPTINLGINVAATQYNYESDSYGTDYDKDAPIVMFNNTNAFNDGVVFKNNGYLQVKSANVILTEDINLSSTWILPNIASGTLYLDLNGHDMIVRQIKVGDTLVISDSVGTGSIKFENCGNDGILVDNGKVIMNSGTLYAPKYNEQGSAIKLTWGTFTMNGGKVVADNNGCTGGSVAVNMSTSNSKFIMNDGEIVKNTGSYAAIQASGSGVKNTVIEINDGSIKSNSVAIYHPQGGKFTVNGGYIEGETAIYAKSGTLAFNGGKMHATADTATDYTYAASGMYATGDAVVIDACGYPGGNPVVTVKGGTYTAKATAAHGFAYYKYDGNTATITNTAGISIYEK